MKQILFLKIKYLFLYIESQSTAGAADAAVVIILFIFLGCLASGTGGHGVGSVLTGIVFERYATSASQNQVAKNGIVGVLSIP